MTLEEMSVVFSADVQPFAQAVDAVQGLAAGAVQAVDAMAAEFLQAGLQAAQGLRAGLLLGKGGVAQAAAELASAAGKAVRDALQIHSPSRVTREMGRMFDEGFLQGILENTPRIEEETRRVSQQAAQGLQSAVPQAASSGMSGDTAFSAPLHVTLPLEIDGYRLGMAVLENVNRIRQSTGRVELKL